MKASTENGKEGAWIRGVWHPNNYASETYVPKTIHEKWFVSGSDGQFSLYNSESEAYDNFLKRIAEEREYCHELYVGEWNIEVEDICWGKVSQDVILRKVPSPYNEDIDPDDEDYDTEDYYEAFVNERRIVKP
jgi:hypothetical protein